MTSDIDFVITWVDGSDPEWLKDRAKFLGEKDIDEARYRDWGLLKYWFRAIEENAPWVRKIHFVTYGHIPEWLNINNPKLHIVKHEDFIDRKYLPTFNSCAIEMNLYKIPGLSEKFVYFNDDMFLNKKIKPDYFFIGGKPVDYAPFGMPGANDYMHYRICCNDIILLNELINKKQIIRKNINKFLNWKYGKGNIKTLLCLPWSKLTGFDEAHTCSPMLKSAYAAVWGRCGTKLKKTCASRKRETFNYNQYLFKYWLFCNGDVVPRKKDSKYYKPLDNDKQKTMVIREITRPKNSSFCINDSKGKVYNESTVIDIIRSFECRYPKASSFEIDEEGAER